MTRDTLGTQTNDSPGAGARGAAADDSALQMATPNAILAIAAPSQYTCRMPKKAKRPLSRQLRDAVDDCGMTRYQISKQTGIPQSTLSRFISGERELSFDVMDRLGEFLGIELLVRGPAKPTAKRRKD